MLQNLTGWHALIIIAVVVLLFGATKLPALAKSVGQSMRILKTEVADRGDSAGTERTDTAPARVVPAPPTVAVPTVTGNGTTTERSGAPAAQ